MGESLRPVRNQDDGLVLCLEPIKEFPGHCLKHNISHREDFIEDKQALMERSRVMRDRGEGALMRDMLAEYRGPDGDPSK